MGEAAEEAKNSSSSKNAIGRGTPRILQRPKQQTEATDKTAQSAETTELYASVQGPRAEHPQQQEAYGPAEEQGSQQKLNPSSPEVLKRRYAHNAAQKNDLIKVYS